MLTIRVIRKDRIDDISVVYDEINVLKDLVHPNIVRLWDTFESRDKSVIVSLHWFLSSSRLLTIDGILLLNLLSAASCSIESPNAANSPKTTQQSVSGMFARRST